MSVRIARMSLGWSFEKLAKESGVAVASIYLNERMGTAGPEDDATMWNALNKHLPERFQRAAAETPEQMANSGNVVSSSQDKREPGGSGERML